MKNETKIIIILIAIISGLCIWLGFLYGNNSDHIRRIQELESYVGKLSKTVGKIGTKLQGSMDQIQKWKRERSERDREIRERFERGITEYQKSKNDYQNIREKIGRIEKLTYDLIDLYSDYFSDSRIPDRQ